MNGQGGGPGVGGLLPLEVDVGKQSGIYKNPFGFKPPTVKFASAINGPALGDNTLLITGRYISGVACCMSFAETRSRVHVHLCMAFITDTNVSLPPRIRPSLSI